MTNLILGVSDSIYLLFSINFTASGIKNCIRQTIQERQSCPDVEFIDTSTAQMQDRCHLTL
jgi:hypothetical protein